MACVVHMVRKYSGCTVRTLLRVPNAASGSGTSDAVTAAEALRAEAQRTLAEARIDSVIEPVLLDAGDLTPKSYELEVQQISWIVLTVEPLCQYAHTLLSKWDNIKILGTY